MQKADPLIRTKLHMPFTRLELVSRPRLQNRVAEGLRGPLTLITTPAGFGKTTLVAAWVKRCGMPAAWLSLDNGDNQAERFLIYLVAAVQEVEPAVGGGAAQLFAASLRALPEAVLTSLINDLDATGKEIALVLDDYQFVSSQDVHEGVSFLLEHCPQTFHLVIATRSEAHRIPGHSQGPYVQHLPQAGRRQPDRGGGARQAARYPPLTHTPVHPII